jgi:hypothetical protein
VRAPAMCFPPAAAAATLTALGSGPAVIDIIDNALPSFDRGRASARVRTSCSTAGILGIEHPSVLPVGPLLCYNYEEGILKSGIDTISIFHTSSDVA